MPAFAITYSLPTMFRGEENFLAAMRRRQGSAAVLRRLGPVTEAAGRDVRLAGGLAAPLGLAAIDAAGQAVDQPHVLVGRVFEADIAGGQPRDQRREQDRHRDHRSADIDGHRTQEHGPIRRAIAIELIVSWPRHWLDLGSPRLRLSDDRLWLGAHLADFLFAGRPCDDRFATIGVLRFPTQKRPGPGPLRAAWLVKSAAEQAAHHVAEESTGAAHAAATAVSATAATAGGTAMRGLIVGVVGRGDAGGDDLRLHRLVLELVQIAGGGIAARSLPALDHATGLIVELAGCLDIEAEAGEAALHVAAQVLVEADLVFGDLVGLFGEGRGIDAGGEVARRRRGTVLDRGDAGERQRLEGAVRIVGEVSVELLNLVGVLDRAPELELDFAGLGDGCRSGVGGGSGRCGRIEVNGAGEIGVPPGQLRLVGLVIDLGADLGHRLLDLDAGGSDVGNERAGEGAVGAGFAIERGLARASGKGNQRAFAGLHLGKAA